MIANAVSKAVQAAATSLARPVNALANRSWYDYPFGRRPRATPERYREIWAKSRLERFPVVDAYEDEMGFRIESDWLHELALLTQVVVKRSEICYQHGRIVYTALRSYLESADVPCVNIVETGTARGFSALCMARALNDAGRNGKVLTFDVVPHDTPMYWNCIADGNGPVTREELLAPYRSLVDPYLVFHQGDSREALKKVHTSRVHFAFLDGMHTFEYVMAEFATIRAKQEPGDMIFFDDYTPALFPGVVRAVDEITGTFGYHKRVIQLDGQRGYVVARKLG